MRFMVAISALVAFATVQVNEGEPIESALRRFKNAVSKSGHLIELKRRKRFESNKEKEIRREKETHRKKRMQKLGRGSMSAAPGALGNVQNL